MTVFSRRTITVRGVNLMVLEGGRLGGPPLVLLHGLRDVPWSLAPIAEAFANTHHLILPALRGHGDSDKPGAYAMEHFLYDLWRVLTTCTSHPADLFGHSLGGQITARFAAAFPDLVRKIVVVEGTGPPEMREETDEAMRIRNYAERLLAQFAEAPPSRGMGDVEEAAARLLRNNPRLPPERAATLAEKATSVGSDGRLRWNFDGHAQAVFTRADNTEGKMFWRNVQCPALLISGELSHEYWATMTTRTDGYDGRYAQGEMDARAQLFPKGRHIPFHHSGHMVHFDEPERLIEETRSFLSEEAL